MKNNKGFTLIEILATVVIIGIISVASVVGYSQYLKSSRQKAYDLMAKSAANAAAEYSMDYMGTSRVTFDELTKGDYLEYPYDPSDKSKACTGEVLINKLADGIDHLSEETYYVTVCCANYSYKYFFPDATKEKADENECPIN